MSFKLESKLICLFAASTCGIAQSQGDLNFDIVLMSETMAVGVALHGSSGVHEGRYIVADERTIHRMPNNEFRLASDLTYAVDCKEPRRIALIVSRFNLETAPNAEPRWVFGYEKEEYENGFALPSLEYHLLKTFNENQIKKLKDYTGEKMPARSWPESSDLVVEYACAVAVNSEPSKMASSRLLNNGGISTLKELTCDLKFSNGGEVSSKIMFEEQLGYVKLGEKWQLKPFINEESIGFTSSSGAVTRINRTNGKFSITSKEGQVYATGLCDLAQKKPKKF